MGSFEFSNTLAIEWDQVIVIHQWRLKPSDCKIDKHDLFFKILLVSSMSINLLAVVSGEVNVFYKCNIHHELSFIGYKQPDQLHAKEYGHLTR